MGARAQAVIVIKILVALLFRLRTSFLTFLRFNFRQEMERQRLADWEKQRKAELMSHRQREQEHVLVLKAKQEHINSDLDKLVKAVEERHSDKHFWS